MNKPWIIGSGQTAVYGKAPLIDYTQQNTYGKYAYVPIESTNEPLYYATLGFHSLPRGVAFCLDFWYQMFIPSDTSLNIYMQNGSSPAVMIWRRPGTTFREQWLHGSVNLGVIRNSVKITISGKIQFLFY